jgi:hypothetical protein
MGSSILTRTGNFIRGSWSTRAPRRTIHKTSTADKRRFTRMKDANLRQCEAQIRVHSCLACAEALRKRIYSRFDFLSAPDYPRKSASIRGWVLIRVDAHIAQRGKVRETSVNARSNLRQFGSNLSTNLQNRMEWFSSLVWQSSCRST